MKLNRTTWKVLGLISMFSVFLMLNLTGNPLTLTRVWSAHSVCPSVYTKWKSKHVWWKAALGWGEQDRVCRTQPVIHSLFTWCMWWVTHSRVQPHWDRGTQPSPSRTTPGSHWQVSTHTAVQGLEPNRSRQVAGQAVPHQGPWLISRQGVADRQRRAIMEHFLHWTDNCWTTQFSRAYNSILENFFFFQILRHLQSVTAEKNFLLPRDAF